MQASKLAKSFAKKNKKKYSACNKSDTYFVS